MTDRMLLLVISVMNDVSIVCVFNPFSVGGQNLTSTYMDDPRGERINKIIKSRIGIQLKKKELTKTFMMIVNGKNLSMVYTEVFQRCKGWA